MLCLARVSQFPPGAGVEPEPTFSRFAVRCSRQLFTNAHSYTEPTLVLLDQHLRVHNSGSRRQDLELRRASAASLPPPQSRTHMTERVGIVPLVRDERLPDLLDELG